MKNIAFIIAISALCAACSGLGKYDKPCRVRGVTLSFMSDDSADAYCQDAIGSRPDNGGRMRAGEVARGCFKRGERPEIVVSEGGGTATLVHEIRHLLAAYCNGQEP